MPLQVEFIFNSTDSPLRIISINSEICACQLQSIGSQRNIVSSQSALILLETIIHRRDPVARTARRIRSKRIAKLVENSFQARERATSCLPGVSPPVCVTKRGDEIEDNQCANIYSPIRNKLTRKLGNPLPSRVDREQTRLCMCLPNGFDRGLLPRAFAKYRGEGWGGGSFSWKRKRTTPVLPGESLNAKRSSRSATGNVIVKFARIGEFVVHSLRGKRTHTHTHTHISNFPPNFQGERTYELLAHYPRLSSLSFLAFWHGDRYRKTFSLPSPLSPLSRKSRKDVTRPVYVRI